MARTEKIYPDWVQEYRTKGTTVKKRGDAYYLYKRTSKRIPGKKYPQPVDTYVGRIMPNGVVPANKKIVTLSDIVVKEFGFSKSVWELCPQGWKRALGESWDDVLKLLILTSSPESYFGLNYIPKTSEELHFSLSAQTSMLSRKIYKEYNVDLKDLYPLKTIYLVKMGKEEAVSRINDQQQEILDQIGVKLLP